jgi:hypothetical protein
LFEPNCKKNEVLNNTNQFFWFWLSKGPRQNIRYHQIYPLRNSLFAPENEIIYLLLNVVFVSNEIFSFLISVNNIIFTCVFKGNKKTVYIFSGFHIKESKKKVKIFSKEHGKFYKWRPFANTII